jgi:tetratricopeptide (TPR) repeat protein
VRTWFGAGLFASMTLQFACGQTQSSQSSAVIAQAEQLSAAHQLEQANELLADYMRNHPDDVAALVKLGTVQFAQALNDDAMKSFEAALRSQPSLKAARDGEVRAATAAALADRRSGSSDYALIDLLRARKVVADSPELLLDIGIQEESMRIYRDADEVLTKARELAPQDLKVLYALAHVELDEQKMPEAEANLRTYLKMMPNDATAHYGLGKLLHMELKVDEARVELNRSIELEPRQSASYYELGEMALEQEQDEVAMSEFQKVLSLAPNHGGALTGIGILLFRAKNYSAAEQYLKNAILNAPEYSTAHHYYALTLTRLGRTEEAKNEAALATKLDEEQTKTSRGNFLKEIQ